MLNAPVDSLPCVCFVPLQAPDAVQDVALVEDQVSVALWPTEMSVGLALRFTVGVGGGGGVELTITCAVREMLPPAPVHCSE
ncbi:MAG TPA: hypothetical protein VLD59_13165 [Steroidobacteraceae bacterium]|nr:hypothetical protein [Steroidobacteraceae bacterium]